MKKTTRDIILFFLFGTIACILLIGSLILLSAMPDILAWISGYIGEFLTYSLFFFGVIAFIVWGFKMA